MEANAKQTTLQQIKIFKHAVISTVPGATHIVVVEATAPYIPIDNFKTIFHFVGDIASESNISKLVFDKRKLTVFHQPSMEWYFVEWKEKMFSLGLKTHRKILPDDRIFRESVKIGRDKIHKLFPSGKFHQMDIQYFNTLDEAIKN